MQDLTPHDNRRDRRRGDAPRPGDPAPPLALPALDGGSVRLEDLRGIPVLVTFLRHAG